MSARGVGHSVRRHHHERSPHRQLDHRRIHHVHDDGAPFLLEEVEGLFGEALAGVLPLDVPIRHSELLLPALVEDGRRDARRSRGVGIGLGGHVHPGVAGALDQGEVDRQVVQTGAVQVHDVERRAGGGCVRDHLLDGRDGHVAHVAIDGHVQLRRELEDPEDLGVVGARVVLVGQSDAETTGPDLGGDGLVDSLGVFHAGIVRLAQELRVFEHQFGAGALGVQDRRRLFGDIRNPQNPQAAVRSRGAVVDDRLTLAARDETRDAGNAPLEFQRGGHAVHRLEPVRLDRLAVRVEVDEPRAHHLAGGIEQHPALLQPVLEHLAGDDHDLVPHHSHVPDCVESGFRIDHPAAGDDQVQITVLGGNRRREQQGEKRRAGAAPETRRHGVGSPCRDQLWIRRGIHRRITGESPEGRPSMGGPRRGRRCSWRPVRDGPPSSPCRCFRSDTTSGNWNS